MSVALFLLADGFEELEFAAPYDILHRGKVQVKTTSIKEISKNSPEVQFCKTGVFRDDGEHAKNKSSHSSPMSLREPLSTAYEVNKGSLNAEKQVKGAHGLSVLADFTIEEIPDFDLLILPGGGKGTENLLASEFVKNLIIKSYNEGKLISAICAAPSVLANAGILKNHSATSYPSVRAEVEPFSFRYLEVPVVIDKTVITSRGPGTAAEFGFALLSLLAAPDTARNVKSEMIF